MAVRFTPELQHPEVVYKYRSFKNEKHLRTITHQELYLAKPSSYNDPFDCKIPVRYDMMTEQHRENKILKMVQIIHIDKTPAEHDEILQRIKKDKQLFFSNLKKESEEQIKKWNAAAGIISLSAKKDDILMWGHYADCHRGFTIGLKTDVILQRKDLEHFDKIVYTEEVQAGK